VLAPGFFARQNTKTPVKVAVVAMVANMVFNLMLVWPLAHAGLALATALSAFLNAGLLGYLLRKEGVLVFQPGWGRFAVQLLGGSTLMCVALYVIAPEWAQWLAMGLWQRVAWVSGLVALGAGLYFAWLGVFGLRVRHLKMRA
jgi:putative peptidoglycan lipid II flippase